MKLLNKITIKFLAIATLVIAGCESNFLDVNTDPLATTDANPDLLLTEGIVNSSNNRVQYIQLYGSMYTQQVTGGDRSSFLRSMERYDREGILLGIWTNNQWGSYTSTRNLLLGIEEAEATGRNNAAAQLKIVRALVFYDLTLMFEDLPFFQSGDLEITAPEFDTQEEIFEGLIALLDQAIAQIDLNAPAGNAIGTNDVIYNGDMNKWLKFANSFKLKILLTMANSKDVSGEISALMSAGNFIGPNEGAVLNYSETVGNQNTGWRLFNDFFNDTNSDGSKDYFIYPTNMFLDILQEEYGVRDPRTDIFFQTGFADTDTEFAGLEVGERATTSTTVVNLGIYKPSTPDHWISYSEQKFMETEAILRGFTTGDANATFLEAVNASMDRFDSFSDNSVGDRTAYLAALPDLNAPSSTPNATTALDHLYLQFYIDTFLRGLDSWTLYRRSGFPSITPFPGTLLGDVIHRWPYEDEETILNPNFPENPPALDAPMWFE